MEAGVDQTAYSRPRRILITEEIYILGHIVSIPIRIFDKCRKDIFQHICLCPVGIDDAGNPGIQNCLGRLRRQGTVHIDQIIICQVYVLCIFQHSADAGSPRILRSRIYFFRKIGCQPGVNLHLKIVEGFPRT